MSEVISQKSPDGLDVALGAAVRLRRRMLGMSQETLAERCGVSFQQIQKYENGANRISFSRLVLIANALSCRVSELIGVLDGLDEGPVDAGPHVRMALPGASELLERYEALSQATRNHLLGLMRAMSGAEG
jgi:transcriptional regulator with XRE-family HTH domain